MKIVRQQSANVRNLTKCLLPFRFKFGESFAARL